MESISHKLFNNNKHKFDNLQSDSVKPNNIEIDKLSRNMNYVSNDKPSSLCQLQSTQINEETKQLRSENFANVYSFVISISSCRKRPQAPKHLEVLLKSTSWMINGMAFSKVWQANLTPIKDWGSESSLGERSNESSVSIWLGAVPLVTSPPT